MQDRLGDDAVGKSLRALLLRQDIKDPIEQNMADVLLNLANVLMDSPLGEVRSLCDLFTRARSHDVLFGVGVVLDDLACVRRARNSLENEICPFFLSGTYASCIFGLTGPYAQLKQFSMVDCVVFAFKYDFMQFSKVWRSHCERNLPFKQLGGDNIKDQVSRLLKWMHVYKLTAVLEAVFQDLRDIEPWADVWQLVKNDHSGAFQLYNPTEVLPVRIYDSDDELAPDSEPLVVDARVVQDQQPVRPVGQQENGGPCCSEFRKKAAAFITRCLVSPAN